MRRFLITIAVLILSTGMLRAERELETATGRVEGPDGKPLEGAQVVVVDDAMDMKPSVAQSDQDGCFTARVPDVNGLFIWGRIFAYKPGYTMQLQRLRRRGNVFRLSTGATVQGVLRDANGRPVTNATVILKSTNDQQESSRGSDISKIPEVLRPFFTVRTAADGRWQMADLPPKGAASFSVVGHSSNFESLARKYDTTIGRDLDFVLKPEAIVTGRATYDDGRPAHNVTVWAISIQQLNTFYRSVEAAPNGDYRLDGLSAGEYYICAGAWNRTWFSLYEHKIDLRAGQMVTVPLVLTQGAVVEGRVVDAADGKPLSNVEVHSTRDAASPYVEVEVRTDREGRYRIPVSPGRHEILVNGTYPYSYLRPNNRIEVYEAKERELSGPFTVDMQKGETKIVDLKLMKTKSYPRPYQLSGGSGFGIITPSSRHSRPSDSHPPGNINRGPSRGTNGVTGGAPMESGAPVD